MDASSGVGTEKIPVHANETEQNKIPPTRHSDGSDPESDPARLALAEKALVRKLDMFLVPQIMALYLFSFLDR
jgi:hypothetical protein